MGTSIVDYFGKRTVEKAVAAYFIKYGANESVRDNLMVIATQKPEEFLEMVCEYIESETV